MTSSPLAGPRPASATTTPVQPAPPATPGGWLNRRGAALRRTTAPVGWSLLGLVVSALAQWAVIVVLARYGGPTMLGQYALGLAIGAPVTLLAGLGLRTVLVTDASGRYGFTEYLRLRAVGMSAAVLSIVLVVLVTGSRHAAVIGLVAAAKALDGFGDIYLGLFQRHHRMRPIGLSMVVNGVLTLVAMAALLALTGDIVWTVLGSVLGSAVGSVAYCRYVARRDLGVPAVGADGATGGPRARLGSPRRLAGLALLALPVGLASGLASFTANVPRYLVGQQLGAAALGIFAALGYVVLASNTLFGSVAQAMLPRMADLYAAGDIAALASLTRRLVAGALALGAASAALAATLGEPLLDLAYGAGYARHARVLTVLTIAVAFSGTVYFVGIALLAVHRFRHQLIANSAALTLAGGAGFLLIPHHGLAGAAWTVVLALAGESLFKAVVLHRALAQARAAGNEPAAAGAHGRPGVRPSAGRRRR